MELLTQVASANRARVTVSSAYGTKDLSFEDICEDVARKYPEFETSPIIVPTYNTSSNFDDIAARYGRQLF